MTWVLIAVGSLLGLLILLAVAGAFLPRAHVATVAARYRAAPDTLWSTIGELVSSGKPPVEVLERSAPSTDHPGRLVTRIADPKLPYGGTWTWEITPGDGGTAVTITEDGWVSNTLFRFLARFVFGHHATARAYLRTLGKKHGEDVAPEIRV